MRSRSGGGRSGAERMNIKRFVDELSTVELSDRAYNQYSRLEGDLRGNAVRRRNLRLYIEQLGSF